MRMCWKRRWSDEPRDGRLSLVGQPMTFDQAMAFIREHNIVLSAARGPVPRMVDVIAGEDVRGSWWAHPKSH